MMLFISGGAALTAAPSGMISYLSAGSLSESGLLPYFFFGTSTSFPPMYGCSAFGIVTEPSAWR